MELKESILKLLKKHPDKKFNVRQITSHINTVSYPTMLKWILVLEAEGKIRVEDYGNIKLVKHKPSQ